MTAIKAKRRRLLLAAALLLLGVLAVYAGLSADKEGQGLPVSAQYMVGGEVLQASAACLYCPETGETLYEKLAYKRLAPASTVKLMTALTARDYCTEEEILSVGSEIGQVARDASRAWLYEGERLSVRQLLYAMLLPSGNDAAYTLAVHCGRKIALLERGEAAYEEETSVKEALYLFVRAMNDKALALGMCDTLFLTPDGYDKSGQYSTAYDLALLAAEFCRDPLLLEIAGCYESREIWASGRESVYYNTNELLNPASPFYYEGALGLKTGTSGRAGACLVGAAELDGRLYIAVVMGSSEEGRYSDCASLLDYAR